MKKLPQRTCIGCGQQKDKRDLIRVVKNNQGEIFLDKSGKEPGRGAYICDNPECLERLIKSRKLEKSFKMKIEDNIYNKLKEMIKE